MAAASPHTKDSGRSRSDATEMNHRPLGSPSAAESHASSTLGADSGAAAEVALVSPNTLPSRALPDLIGRKSQRAGGFAEVWWIVAARSAVRRRQAASDEHRTE